MVQRSLGVSSPEGRDVYEFFLTVKSRPSILGKVSEIFGRNKVDMIGAHAQVSDDKKTGFIIIYAEMENAGVPPERLASILREQDYVIDVRYEEKNTRFFEGFLFPLTSGGHYRVFAVGSREWADLVMSLHRTFGSAAEALLYQQGVAVGRGMVERIGAKFSSYPGDETVMENFMLLFRAAGFGVLSFVSEEGRMRARIDSPVIAGEILDYFTIGIVAGALSRIHNRAYRVGEARLGGEGIEILLEPERTR